jgi:transcriptional regulator with XRE-family HTH domain
MVTMLKIERVRRGLSQAKLAALTSGQIDQPRLSLLERGLPPKKSEAKALEAVMGLPPGALWPDLSA